MVDIYYYHYRPPHPYPQTLNHLTVPDNYVLILFYYVAYTGLYDGGGYWFCADNNTYVYAFVCTVVAVVYT